MGAAKLNKCGICLVKESGKYRCPIDDFEYCSVICFKSHKSSNCSSTGFIPIPTVTSQPIKKRKLNEDEPSIKLESLNWPITIQDSSLLSTELISLTTPQYESIAKSNLLRNLLKSEKLITLLRNIHEEGREELVRALLGKTGQKDGVYRPSAAITGKYRAEGNSAIHSISTATRGRGGIRGRGRGGRGGGASSIRVAAFGEEERKLMMEFVNTVEQLL